MTKLAEQFKQGADHAWQSLAEGWRELSARAGGALTRFWAAPGAGAQSGTPSPREEGRLPFGGWAFMASDVFDDDEKVIVRIEAPGMRREDFNIELDGDTLTVWGEKRSDREIGRGHYSVVQCAYGSFRRDVALPARVRAEEARANYRDGVLRIELPKAEAARAVHIAVRTA
ncbi:Hsp20/alpha crystallin family protein [Massilia sp. R2A-15]|uniref:Hsp20/alpha crystallin family protein n=1 Tax=Massilia sp. R2A-15 TaxID=3064278 RepID=UPI0027342948|nr:Hsp20/alpha crystallin family protein [Massilia sp. R2A-15]WLI91092.1 Hsp20/alpha crystallin family protein [Massilia sp. R2A-15]